MSQDKPGPDALAELVARAENRATLLRVHGPNQDTDLLRELCDALRSHQAQVGEGRSKELKAHEEFAAAIYNLVNGSDWDLTDSPKSLIGNIRRLWEDLRECVAKLKQGDK